MENTKIYKIHDLRRTSSKSLTFLTLNVCILPLSYIVTQVMKADKAEI